MANPTFAVPSATRNLLGGATAIRIVCSCLVLTLSVGPLATAAQAHGSEQQRVRAAELELQRLVAQLQQETARLARPPARTLRPGERAPGVAITVPMYGPLTAEQKRLVEASNAEALGMLGRTAAGAACSQGQAASPYYPYGRPGNTTTGWHGTISGPRRNSCY